MLFAPAQLQRHVPHRGTGARPRQSRYQPTGWFRPSRGITIVLARTTAGAGAGRGGAATGRTAVAKGAEAGGTGVAAAASMAAAAATSAASRDRLVRRRMSRGS